jgi:hypothetical protein
MTTFTLAAKALYDIRNAWSLAASTVSSFCSQLKLTSVSLAQIHHLLLEDMDTLKNRPDVIDAFDTAVTACLVSSTCLEKFVWKITSGVLNGEKSTWTTKFKMLWNEPEVIELSG